MESIKLNHEFQRAYRKGKSHLSKEVVVYVFRNRRAQNCRYGITTSKKIGNAVVRNRARRVIRAAWRALEAEMLPGYDFIFVARAKTAHIKSTEMLRVLRGLLASYRR